jgi:hypothetical protein
MPALTSHLEIAWTDGFNRVKHFDRERFDGKISFPSEKELMKISRFITARKAGISIRKGRLQQ